MARSKKARGSSVPVWAWALGIAGVGVAYALLRRRPASAATPTGGNAPRLGDAFGNLGDAFGAPGSDSPSQADLEATGTYLFGGPTDTPLLGIDPMTGLPTTTSRPRTPPRRTSTTPAAPSPSTPASTPLPTAEDSPERQFANSVSALQTQLRRFTSLSATETGTWSRATWNALVGVLGSHPNTVCGSPRAGDYFVPTRAEVQIWTDCLAQL